MIKKRIRKQVLKVNCIKRWIIAYRLLQKKQRHRKRWARIMRSGGMIRDAGEEKLYHEISATVTDDGILVDYMNGQKVCGDHVTPVFIDSVTWGGMK